MKKDTLLQLIEGMYQIRLEYDRLIDQWADYRQRLLTKFNNSGGQPASQELRDMTERLYYADDDYCEEEETLLLYIWGSKDDIDALESIKSGLSAALSNIADALSAIRAYLKRYNL